MFGGMFGGGFGGGGGGSFEAFYRCYPVSFIDKLDAENGDKVFLPASALDRLGRQGDQSMSDVMHARAEGERPTDVTSV